MKRMARMATKKSYSWWWDSHISPKNSKWLADNLEDMDRCVKEMLKLIEEEGDSFAKKAEMYYQKRPDLIAHVEDFYRMYRALAERYDNVTGELRRNIPSSLQSQGSGSGSDFGSEPASPLPEPERKPPRPKSGPRAAGFDYFLGSGGSSEHSRKGSDDGSSSSESDSESDISKDANGDDASSLHQRILELEHELHDANEKLQELEGKYSNGRCEHLGSNDHVDCALGISELEKRLMAADEKFHVAESEIFSLKQELAEHNSSTGTGEVEPNLEDNKVPELEELIAVMEAEISQYKQEIENLKGVLISANQQFEADLLLRDDAIKECKEEFSGLSNMYSQEKTRLKVDLAILESFMDELKVEITNISQEKSLLQAKVVEQEHMIHELQSSSASAAEQFLQEKNALEAQVSDLSLSCASLEDSIDKLKVEIKNISQEKSLLEAKVVEQERIVHQLQSSSASATEQFLQEKCALESHVSALSLSCASLNAKVTSLVAEIKQLETERARLSVENGERTEEVNKNLDALKLRIDMLTSEKEELGAKLSTLTIDVKCRDEQICEMNKHHHQLHLEQAKLITKLEEAGRTAEDLRSRVKELEEEVDRQKVVIIESAEGKREAIRQLCFSMEHYRDGYLHLRQVLQGQQRVLQGHKRPVVIAT